MHSPELDYDTSPELPVTFLQTGAHFPEGGNVSTFHSSVRVTVPRSLYRTLTPPRARGKEPATATGGAAAPCEETTNSACAHGIWPVPVPEMR
ncbi:hypothetical protein GCM10018785_75530 [Streptomyces longispororuber]|uniref:Uncharacterized protein n=1 Tax=Streptomyces longispororuber TaxID=68230 RepID=A0A919AEV8_9ACTN|nr:hypothetical protein GCM10018785_75530 [Streptomyces longispororuber]